MNFFRNLNPGSRIPDLFDYDLRLRLCSWYHKKQEKRSLHITFHVGSEFWDEKWSAPDPNPAWENVWIRDKTSRIRNFWVIVAKLFVTCSSKQSIHPHRWNSISFKVGSRLSMIIEFPYTPRLSCRFNRFIVIAVVPKAFCFRNLTSVVVRTM
jgi:hypothetical protein